MNATYTNPVIPGFHPDPSICRAGEDYYLVTSSFEYFPGVPLFHSRDLVHWRQIGHCLTRPSQLPLQNAWPSQGIYAPTLRYHQGRFYMITTNNSHGGNFIVQTDDPAGEWSEPLWVDKPGIDPSLLFDDDGKVYFTAVGNFQGRIDLATGKVTERVGQIWLGSGGKFPEGPHLYKIRGRYYLLDAEGGGVDFGHMVTIARSDSPWGPFVPCPHNPILSHRSLDKPIQCTGHGDLVEDHRGNWWLVFLGTRPSPFPHYTPLGRETFLAPVRWTEDGWPVVGNQGRVEPEMQADCLPPHPWPATPARDDFDQPTLACPWTFLRNPYERDWSLSQRPGWLRLQGSAVTPSDLDSPAWVGRRQQHHGCTVATLLEFQPRHEHEEAGLMVFMNAWHHYEIARRGARVIVRRRIGSLSAEVASRPTPEGPLRLAIEADLQEYRFLLNGECLASGEMRYLSTEVAGTFTGMFFALYATGNGQPSSVPADFDWFDYRPHDRATPSQD